MTIGQSDYALAMQQWQVTSCAFWKNCLDLLKPPCLFIVQTRHQHVSSNLYSHAALPVHAHVPDDNTKVLFYLQRSQWVQSLCQKAFGSTVPRSTSLLGVAG